MEKTESWNYVLQHCSSVQSENTKILKWHELKFIVSLSLKMITLHTMYWNLLNEVIPSSMISFIAQILTSSLNFSFKRYRTW
jgi:uncharacterized protein YejL (UPF0352 family)